MKQEIRCQCCGASMKKFWHKVTPGIAIALIKLNKAVNITGRNDVNIYRMPPDLTFEHTELTNWTKMRFNALVAKIRIAGTVKRGHWCITRKGYQFLAGKEIPQETQSFRNKVSAHSDVMVTISQVLRSHPKWQTIDQIRFDYAEPTIEMDEDIDGSLKAITVARRATRLKRGKPLCPSCGNMLAVDITTQPNPADPNAVIIVAKKQVCRKCGYTQPLT